MENLKTVSTLRLKEDRGTDHKARNTNNHLYLMVLEHYSGLRGIDIHATTVPVFLKELDRRSFRLKLSAEADRKCTQQKRCIENLQKAN